MGSSRRGKILKGYEFKAGDNSVVHHTTVFVDYTGKLKKYDQQDPAPGYDAFAKGGTMEFGSAVSIGGWAPGVDPYTYPDGVGFYIEANADVAIENHYHLSGKATTDQSSVALYFADASEVAEYASSSIAGSQRLHIKAGNSQHVEKVWNYVPVDLKLISVLPHMHYIGKSAKLEVITPDGQRKPLLHVNDWDLRWQGVYPLREPMLIKKGSIIEGVFTYDNSDENHDNPYYPAQDMFWGWGSNDEMLEFYLTYVPVSDKDYGKMIGASFAAFEHFYEASKRVKVDESNLEKVYARYRSADLWSDEGQILLISILESCMGDEILRLFEQERGSHAKNPGFIINHAELLTAEAYFSFDQAKLVKAADRAATMLAKLLAKDETNWNASFSLGKMLIDSGDPQHMKEGAKILEATVGYQESQPKKAKYSRLYLELGKYYYTLRDDKNAEAYLKRGLKHHPDNPGLLQALLSEGRIQKKTLN